MPGSEEQLDKDISGGAKDRGKKSPWLKGKGEEMLKVCYSIATNEEESASNRLSAAKVVIEHDLGKSRQQGDMSGEPGEKPRKVVSLSQRRAALAEAVKHLDKI